MDVPLLWGSKTKNFDPHSDAEIARKIVSPYHKSYQKKFGPDPFQYGLLNYLNCVCQRLSGLNGACSGRSRRFLWINLTGLSVADLILIMGLKCIWPVGQTIFNSFATSSIRGVKFAMMVKISSAEIPIFSMA